jgi:RNA polymerase sigma factor (sigma-70 family)
MQPTDDGVLLRQYAENHSDEAFAALVARHIDLVYSVALRCIGDPHQAEEVVQAVFILLAKKAGQLRHDKALSSWLFQTTRLTASSFIRCETRRHRREQEAHMQSVLNDPGNDVWPRIAPLLDDAVAGLNEKDRDAIILRFYEGRNLREVGAILGASEAAAEKRVSRAVERLREFLTKRGVTVGASGLVIVISTNAVQAAPIGLAGTISTATALGGTTLTTATTIGKAIAMTTLQKTLITGIVALACAAGVSTYVVQQVKARASSARVAPTASPIVAAGAADSETGILKTPDGKALPDAEVFLSTTSTAVPIYSTPPPKVAVTRTQADGRFSFPLDPKNRAIIVVHEKGYGQVTVTQLMARHELTLQPWARVKGTLREGSTPLAGQTIQLSRSRFGSKFERDTFRTHHDTTTETDAAGHYIFPRVAPGDAWISWLADRGSKPGNKYSVQTRYFDIQPGQSLIADIGGRGRPVTGRAVLADSDAQLKYYGSVWPKPLHLTRPPPNWSELSAEEQTALMAAWEKSPDAKLYNQEKAPIDYRPAADGTFIVRDLSAGDYRLFVGSWANGPMTSPMISRGNVLLTIPEMPGGRSDEPLDVGEIRTYLVAPLRTGDPAPPFETSTFDGKPLKLADFKGKYVLLNFWRSDDTHSDDDLNWKIAQSAGQSVYTASLMGKSLADMADLKMVQATWGKDQRFVLIGLNFDRTLDAAKQFSTDNKLTWTQCYLGEQSDLYMRYRRPGSMLIGPDGLMIRADMHGPGIATAVKEVLGTK